MFPECEAAPATLSDEFTRALRLLHSTEAGSADELRELLVASIAKRYGSKRSNFSRLSQSNANEEPELGLFTDCAGNDVGDKDEVPRISIPDEDQTDDDVCKVCNVSEFGPLVLVQCQECKELYHPLCHQPPIIDGDIHDPDFFWWCTECERKPSL